MCLICIDLAADLQTSTGSWKVHFDTVFKCTEYAVLYYLPIPILVSLIVFFKWQLLVVFVDSLYVIVDCLQFALACQKSVLELNILGKAPSLFISAELVVLDPCNSQ